MNNVLRVWDGDKDWALHRELDQIPQEDLLFVDWHPTHPVILAGGVDMGLYLVNAVNGALMGSFLGHEADINAAAFTIADKGKQIISVGSDKTVRRWQPHPFQAQAVSTIRSEINKKFYHESEIQCFALHQTKNNIYSGDASGKVFAADYTTG
jgi:WD40 repeat protein